MCFPFTANAKRPGVVHIVGASNSGKTTLIERLLPRLRTRGLRVGTLKHAPHGFDLGARGKDSWRHAQAGAEVATVISPTRAMWVRQTSDELSLDDAVSEMSQRVDLVLVEGFKRAARAPRVELTAGDGARVEIVPGRCRMTVRPSGLLPSELDDVVSFCVGIAMGGAPCRLP